MRVRRDYRGWDPSEPLDPEAESVLSFLDRLAVSGSLPDLGEIVASIDEYGVVFVTVACGTASELFLQAGDGWDRALWRCPSGRTHEWVWRDRETPDDVGALLAGRGVERTTLFRRRVVGVQLVVDGRALATSGTLRLALFERLGLRLRESNQPAL